MIIDCFPFFNEFDILNIHLHEMDSWVDRFVLVESRETFSGNEKPLYFEQNKHKFEKFLPKITHLVSPPAKEPPIQDTQRNYIMEGLKDCLDDDLILIGDVDEIPRVGDFQRLCDKQPLKRKHHWVSIQAQYFFYMNLYRPGGWAGTVFIYYKDIKEHYEGSPHTVRLARRNGRWIERNVYRRGCHFTFMGGFDAVRLKGRSFSHFKQRERFTDEMVRQQMKEGGWMRGRQLVKVPIDETFPKWFVENKNRFRHLIYEGEKE